MLTNTQDLAHHLQKLAQDESKFSLSGTVSPQSEQQ